MEGFDYQKLS